VKSFSTLCGIVMVSILAMLPLSAQESATLVLRDGQRLSGEVVEMTGEGVTLRTGNQERDYPVNTVAAIEYVAGPVSADTRAKLDAGKPVVVLRNGSVVDGRVVGITRQTPRRFSIDTPAGPHAVMSNEIAQIYLHSLPTAVSLAPGAIAHIVEGGQTLGGIAVPAKEAWTPTSITVRQGDKVRFSVTGDIRVSPTTTSTATGASATTTGASLPVRSAPEGALIGRIGDGQPFVIGGTPQPLTMPASGPLFIGINDDTFDDNNGQFMVMIAR
jgi:hypothetical protein